MTALATLLLALLLVSGLATSSNVTLTISLISPTGEPVETFRDYIYESYFDLAVADVNKNVLSPESVFNSTFQLKNTTFYRSLHDDPKLDAFGRLMQGVAAETVAAIAPFRAEEVQVLAQLADNANIPLLSPVLSRRDVEDYMFDTTTTFFSMKENNLFRGIELLDGGILKHFQWHSVGLLVSDEKRAKDAVLQFENLDEIYGVYHEKQTIAKVGGNVTADLKTNIRAVLKIFRDSGLTIIVTSLEQNAELYATVFEQAKEENLIGEDIAWICLLIPDEEELLKLDENRLDLMEGMLATTYSKNEIDKVHGFSLLSREEYEPLANTYDAVWTLAHAIDKTLATGLILNYTCPDDLPVGQLDNGLDLMSNLKEVTYNGASGFVAMQSDGTRKPRFDIKNLVNTSLGTTSGSYRFKTIGTWDDDAKFRRTSEVRYYKGSYCKPSGIQDECRHRLRVLVPEAYSPYIDLSLNREGNNRFSGWVIDLFKYLTDGCFAEYEFNLTDWTWDRMIRELRRQDTNFDMAIAPLALTSSRLRDVSFTRNIRTAALGAIVLRNDDTGASMWQFWSPFSLEVWLLTLAFFVFTGFILFFLEWRRDVFPEGSPNMADSMFISFSTLTYTQDQDAVLTAPGRAYIIVVCFVTLILSSCFTANLTAFLLRRNYESAYDSIEDFHNKTVGSLSVTGDSQYLQSLPYPRLDVKEFDSVSDGIEAVKNKSLTAFIADDGVLRVYQAERDPNCELDLIGTGWHKVNTGFVVRQSSVHAKYLNRFNDRILRAWDEEHFDELEKRHFEVNSQRCSDSTLSGERQSLDLYNLGGIFIIFGGVTVFCLLGNALLQYMYKSGLLQRDVTKEKPGSHATAQLIARAMETASVAGSMPRLPNNHASSSISVRHDDGIALRRLSPLADGSADTNRLFRPNENGETLQADFMRSPLPPIS